MSNPHPITPPDKQLVRKWIEDWAGGQMKGPVTEDQLIVATQAAQWGADQELEACCQWLNGGSKIDYDTAALLRTARRPKPPSLKEQALTSLRRIEDNEATYLDAEHIRRALEALPND